MPRTVIFDPSDRRIRHNLFGSVNMYVSDDGCTPSFDHGEMSGSDDKLHYFSRSIETKNPSGNPRHYAACNTKIHYFEGGTLTADNTFSDVVMDMVIFDDAVTSPNKRLIAFFGNSTTGSLSGGGHAWRNLGTDTTPWTYHVGATAVQAWLAERSGHRGMLATGGSGTGRTFLGENAVSQIIAGLYDGTTTNVGAAERVGHSDWPVIKLAVFLRYFLAGKGTGAYYRDSIDLDWLPLQHLVEKLPHGLNTKAMAASENGIIIPMNDGTLWKWDGRVVRNITPTHRLRKPKDSERGRFVFVSDRGDKLAVGRAPFQPVIDGPTAARMGFRFFTRIAGTYAEITSGVTDGDLTTPASANMNAWGGTSTDRLIAIGPVPIVAMVPRVTRNPNGNNNSFATPQYGTVSGGPPTFASAGTLIDHTILSTASRSLVLTGFPPAAAEPVLAWDGKTNYWDAASVTFSFGGGIGDVTGYVFQVSPTNTTAMSATTTIDEIGIVLARPGLKLADSSGPFTSANNFTSLHASSALTEVLMGDPRGQDYDWAIPYAIPSWGGELVASWTNAPTGALSNGGQGLLIFGRSKQFIIAEGARDPRGTPYPRLTQWTTTEHGPKLTMNDIQLRDDEDKPADPTRPKVIREIRIDGEDITTADYAQFWIDCLDGRTPWKFGTGKGTSPIIIRNPNNQGYFYDCTVHYLFHDQSQTDHWAPLTRRIEVVWEYYDGPLHDVNPPTVALA